MPKNNYKSFFKKITLLFVLITVCSISLIVNNLSNVESISSTDSLQFCNPKIDKNGDKIPDEIIPKKNINWAFCDLSDTSFSELISFDYKESKRPFVGEYRYHTSKYAEPIPDTADSIDESVSPSTAMLLDVAKENGIYLIKYLFLLWTFFHNF